MFLLDYEKDNFFITIELDEFIEKEDYNEIVLYLKGLFLSYSFELNKWKVPVNRVEEIIMWLEKDQKEWSITTEAKEEFEKRKVSYPRETIFYRGKQFDPYILNEEIEAFDYQIKAINYRLQRNVTQDAYDAGTGKTFIAICTFAQRYKEGLIDGIMIMVPIGMSYHWKYEILKFVNVFTEDDIQIVDNDSKKKPFEQFKDKKILIVRQDLIAHHIASYRADYTSKKSLKGLKWNVADYVDIYKKWDKNNLQLIVDESHSIKNRDSIRTKALFSIKKYFKYRLLLSATPSINGMEDLYSPLTFLDRSIIPMSNNAFKLWLSNSIGNKFDKYAINSYNTENANSLMQSYQHIFTQVRKEELNEIKTKKIINIINCELNPIQRRLYHLIVDRELRMLQEEYDKITWRQILSKIHLLLEVFDNPLLLAKRHYDDVEINSLLQRYKLENDSKFIYLKNKVEDVCDNLGKKIIVYDTHPLTLDIFYDKFAKYNPLLIHGQVKTLDKEKDRKEKENLFNYDEKHRMILLSAYTSSAGINLQHGGDTILVYTLPWNAELFRQLQDRTWRATSTKDSLVEVLNYPESLDGLRTKRNFNRIELNSKMDEVLSEKDLERLLNGN